MPPTTRARASTAKTLAWNQARLAPVVLVKGSEVLLADRAVASLLAAAKKRDTQVEVTWLEAAVYEPGTLRTLTSPSLFGEERCIVVTGVEAATDAFLTDVLGYLTDPAPDASLVLRHAGGVRGKKVVDAVSGAGFPVVACDPVKRDADKVAFARQEFDDAKRPVDSYALRALVDALGNDLAALVAGCAQLIADTSGPITADDVRRYYAGRVEASSFAVADAMALGDGPAAIRLLRHAFATGAEPVPMVGALALKVRTLVKVQATRGRGGSPGRDLGLASWQLDKANRELAGWTPEGLAVAITAIAAADAEVKGGGRNAEYAVERAVLRVVAARR